MNQLICDNKISEVKTLESLSVEEYYSTLNTYCKIIEDKNKSIESTNEGSGGKEKNVARSMSARRTSSTT